MPSRYRKRCKRYGVPGDAHFLTFSCDGRRPYLARDRTRQWLLESIAMCRQRQLFELWAYVIMPEHGHLVIRPMPEVSISQILKTLKQSVSMRARIWLRGQDGRHGHSPEGNSFPFWQRGGGYDRNLRSDADIHEKIEYCHNNPVRRGLVARGRDWPWSSCRAWEAGIDEPIAIDRESVPTIVVTET